MTYAPDKRLFSKPTILKIVGAHALALAFLLGVQAPASAQAACASHEEVTKALASGHSEEPVGIGLASTGNVVEVFSSSDGSTWSIVMTMPNGVSCLVTSGESWESLSKLALGPQA